METIKMNKNLKTNWMLLCVLALAPACSDEPGAGEHPPVVPAAPHGLVGYQASALLNCSSPDGRWHWMTNIVVTRTIPTGQPGVCPAAWFESTDPFSWRFGVGASSPAPTVPSGTCQWAGMAWQPGACQASFSFTCPSGLWYSGVVTALSTSGDPWSKAKVSMSGNDSDGSCKRYITATFNAL